MIKRNNKKGFTIVELVIVIAVIAILAAVLIPTFAGIVKKANESADIQAVRQMNTALAADGAVESTSLAELYRVLGEAGMNAEDYTPLYKDRYFYWDMGLNMILYLDSNRSTVIFPEDVTSSGKIYCLNGTFDSSDATIELAEDGPAFTTPEGEGAVPTVEYTVASAADFVKLSEYISENTAKINAKGASKLIINLPTEIDVQGADINFTSESTQNLNVVLKGAAGGTTIRGLYVSDKHVTTGNTSDGVTSKTYGHSMFNYIGDLTVENITIVDSAIGGFGASQGGFFAGQADNVTFKNVTVENSDIEASRKVGVLAGYVHGQISLDDVTIKDCTVTASGGEAGILFGLIDATAVTTGTKIVTNAGVTVINSKVNIASTSTTKTVTVDGVNREFAQENGNWRVSTAQFCFYGTKPSVSPNVDNKVVTGLDASTVTVAVYAPIDTPEAFAAMTGKGPVSE